jgi:hypothetical protein
MTNLTGARAVADLYHAWITGLVLTLVTRKNARVAEEFVFSLFRQQHLEKFLPGLEKLGLAEEPDAVAAAKYHYFSNQLGGVKVEYLEEGPHKAWVRYPPPRWIWSGTAICGIPSAVNRAMLRGWHAHNGVSLGNPRLGFVCTKTTVDGQPGLEGYYREFPDELEPGQRLQFRPEESCPVINPEDLPALAAQTWPDARKARAFVNYSMEYVRNALPLLVRLLGPQEAVYLGRICALQTGMHSYDSIAAAFGVTGNTAPAFLSLLEQVLAASGDRVHAVDNTLQQTNWRLFSGLALHPAVRVQWLAVIEGLLSVHNRFLSLAATESAGSLVLRITGNNRG